MLLDSFVLLMLPRCSVEQLWHLSLLSTTVTLVCSHLSLYADGRSHLCEHFSHWNTTGRKCFGFVLNLTSDTGAFCRNCLWYSLLHVPPFSAFFYVRFLHQMCAVVGFFPECVDIFSRFKDFLKNNSHGRISDTCNRIKASFLWIVQMEKAGSTWKEPPFGSHSTS